MVEGGEQDHAGASFDAPRGHEDSAGVRKRRRRVEAPVTQVKARAFRIPTDAPESDGTLAWDATTLVVVEVEGGGKTGLGYGYASAGTARTIHETLRAAVKGQDALDVPASFHAMRVAIRNLGRPGVVSMAISAVDAALWDLKAKLLDLPLARLFGMARPRVPLYGSGGFTSYDIPRLVDQLGGWAAEGFARVKMKIGRHPARDVERVRAVREAIGPGVLLFTDANGAYSRKEALRIAEDLAALDVRWLEEPVSSDDLEGLRLLRDRAPASLDIAAGEYGYDAFYFRRMLAAGAVDVLQADATRCGGFTGFLQVASLCDAFAIPLSSHCAPSLHVAVGCAAANVEHLEYFYDHVRIEKMFFDGAPVPLGGTIAPDLSRPGIGLELKAADAAPFAVED